MGGLERRVPPKPPRRSCFVSKVARARGIAIEAARSYEEAMAGVQAIDVGAAALTARRRVGR